MPLMKRTLLAIVVGVGCALGCSDSSSSTSQTAATGDPGTGATLGGVKVGGGDSNKKPGLRAPPLPKKDGQ